jgi:hypothetical protein
MEINRPLGKLDASSSFSAPSTSQDDLAATSHTFDYQLNISELIVVEILRDPNVKVDIEMFRTNIRKGLEKLVLGTKSRSMASLLSALCFGGHRMSTAYLGHECLKILETQLRPSFLSSCSQVHLRALILLLFGAILNVILAEPVFDLPPFPEVNPDANSLSILSTNRFISGKSGRLWNITNSLRCIERTPLSNASPLHGFHCLKARNIQR